LVRDGHRTWLENVARRGVSAEVDEIVRQHGITRESFAAVESFEEIIDPDGKSFFLIPRDTGGCNPRDVRGAVLMTYVLNAGTGYGKTADRPGVTNDFPETPYSAAEVRRIIDRQHANRWSYDRDVGFVHRNGGRLITTPNGMLMGLGGNRMLGVFSQQGGTCWGDIFMVNIDRPADPAEQLRRIVRSGHAWFAGRDGAPFESDLDLDRVLHHEERHCSQWAAKGYLGMLRDYGWELIRERVLGKSNRLEKAAGLSDGGYR
jgi:hypothetical protein